MKKIIISFTIASFMNLIGCYSSEVVRKDILFTENQAGKINNITIVTNKSERFELIEGTYKVVHDSLYVNGLKEGTSFMEQIDAKIALADIENLELQELNIPATIGFASLVVAAITAGGILVIGLNKWP